MLRVLRLREITRFQLSGSWFSGFLSDDLPQLPFLGSWLGEAVLKRSRSSFVKHFEVYSLNVLGADEGTMSRCFGAWRPLLGGSWGVSE